MLTTLVTRFTLLVAAVLLHACADGARDVQDGQPNDPPSGLAQASYSINAAELANLCTAGKVTATLSINGGAAQNIAVDCAQKMLTGQLSGLSSGTHRFDLDLHRDSVWIIRRSAVAELPANKAVALSFGAAGYIDSDNDGYTNLAELNIYGQLSNAWTNAAVRPLSEIPRFSASYIMIDTVTEAFLEGRSDSADYQTTFNP